MEQCGHRTSGLRGRCHAAQGEKNISASAFCVAHALIFLAAVYTEGGQNWQMPVISSYVLWAQLPCLSCRSARPSVCRDGERGNLLFPKDTPRGRRHADKRGRERGERRASIFLACSRAIAEIRAFSRSSFLPSESLPRGIERPPSLLPSFHIALMV